MLDVLLMHAQGAAVTARRHICKADTDRRSYWIVLLYIHKPDLTLRPRVLRSSIYIVHPHA